MCKKNLIFLLFCFIFIFVKPFRVLFSYFRFLFLFNSFYDAHKNAEILFHFSVSVREPRGVLRNSTHRRTNGNEKLYRVSLTGTVDMIDGIIGCDGRLEYGGGRGLLTTSGKISDCPLPFNALVRASRRSRRSRRRFSRIVMISFEYFSVLFGVP